MCHSAIRRKNTMSPTLAQGIGDGSQMGTWVDGDVHPIVKVAQARGICQVFRMISFWDAEV